MLITLTVLISELNRTQDNHNPTSFVCLFVDMEVDVNMVDVRSVVWPYKSRKCLLYTCFTSKSKEKLHTLTDAGLEKICRNCVAKGKTDLLAYLDTHSSANHVVHNVCHTAFNKPNKPGLDTASTPNECDDEPAEEAIYHLACYARFLNNRAKVCLFVSCLTAYQHYLGH